MSLWQAQQLWNLSGELCERAMARLIKSRFLIPAADGTYVRRDESLARIEEIESMLRAMSEKLPETSGWNLVRERRERPAIQPFGDRSCRSARS